MKYIILLILLTFPVVAQSDWKTKDFDKWDARDVEIILNKSGWVKKQSLKLPRNSFISWLSPDIDLGRDNAKDMINQDISNNLPSSSATVAVAGATKSTEGFADPRISVGAIGTIEVTLDLKLRSSLAVRLALIRQLQLENNANNLSSAEKVLFLQKQKGLYDCPACADNYVITLSSISSEDKHYDFLYNSLKRARFEEIKKYIYLLNDKGEKRELTHFVAPKSPGGESQFFFKRFNDKGNLLLTKENKYFLFKLEPYQVNSASNFKIDVKPLIVGDKVDF